MGLTDVDIGATKEDQELYSRSIPLRGFWDGDPHCDLRSGKERKMFMKMMKRSLAMLLAFVIVLGLVPVSVFATGTATGDFNSTNALVDATVIMSDLHVGTNKTGTTPTDSVSKKSLLQTVLNKIKEDYPNVSTVNSAGDMFSSNETEVKGDVTEFTTNSRGERIWNLIFTATTEEAKETRTIVVNGQDGSKKEATIEVDVVEAANMNLKLPVFVNQGETYTLTVETSSSVAAIRVGKGEQNTNYTQNGDGTKRTWTVELTAGVEDGKETVTVTAFDENDIASAIAIAQVQVQSFTPSVQVSCKDTVTEGQTLRVTVTTSSDVAAVEVNGVLATTYRTNKRTQQRTWTVELDVKAGTLKVNATAYDKDGRSFTDPEQAKTVTVNENPASIIGKIINDFVNTLRGWFGW